MPAVDLARLRKQAARLADFFFVPDEFIRHLREVLDFYVNYSARAARAVAPAAGLPTFHTPRMILKEIEQEVAAAAGSYPDATLELADRLWDAGYLETRLLAAYLLGCIPPQEERLLARLTAWTGQTRDANLRARLLDSSLARLRKESPAKFIELVAEWLQPARARLWSNGLQAAQSAVADPAFSNLPPLLTAVQPVLQAAPAKLQNEIEGLVLALYRAYPAETTYFLRQVLSGSTDPMTAITFRRISASLPPRLQEALREFIRAKPLSSP